MLIYLLRHGVAEDRPPGHADDRERALTPEGAQRMQQEAQGMRRLAIELDRLLTSPYARARQTAEIVGRALAVAVEIEPALAPGMRLEDLQRAIERAGAQRVMVVGHEPDLSSVGGALIGGGQLQFKKGALALIDLPSDSDLDGQLCWLLAPSVLRALGQR